MNKLIQEMLPPDIACARETRDLLLSCCVGASPAAVTRPRALTRFTEFIHLVSSEANEICEKDSRKTITAEHILGALKVRVRLVLPAACLSVRGYRRSALRAISMT